MDILVQLIELYKMHIFPAVSRFVRMVKKQLQVSALCRNSMH